MDTKPKEPDSSDWLADVRPKAGWLAQAMQSIANPRKHRWNIYLRACRAIPRQSPVYGKTGWKVINERRHTLIMQEMQRGLGAAKSEELAALQKVAGTMRASTLIAGNLLLSRKLRQLKRLYPESVNAQLTGSPGGAPC